MWEFIRTCEKEEETGADKPDPHQEGKCKGQCQRELLLSISDEGLNFEQAFGFLPSSSSFI